MEITLLISSSLLFITLGFVFVYFRRIRAVSEKYVEASDVLSDIILSFKTDLRQQEDRIQSVSKIVEDLSLRDGGSKRADEYGVELNRVKDCLEQVSHTWREVSVRVEELSKRVDDLFIRQKENLGKISELEQTQYREPVMPDKIETVIPIKRERALARLTETELRVLDILADEGEKTASQIKSEIDLTREHTARLMKSLYTRGYIERNTERLPYVYRIKDEMLGILKRQMKASG